MSSYYNIEKNSEFSFEKLKTLIEENNLNTVDKTLELTKYYYPDFFDNYILMYHSRSLQGSSFDAPRAILFDRSGHFVFTFNGQEGQRGFERIEIMQYRSQTQKFEFREIVFSDSKKVEFSQSNPPKCLACHQNTKRAGIDPRPNWEPYNIWPGAFGSMGGDIELSLYHRGLKRLKDADPMVLQNAALEEEKLSDFLENIQPHHPRYKYLSKEKFDAHQVVDFTEILSIISLERVFRILNTDLSHVQNSISDTIDAFVKCQQLMVSEKAYHWLQANWGADEYEAYEDPGSPAVYFQFEHEFNSTEEYDNYVDAKERIKNSSIKEETKWKYPKASVSEFFHHIFEPLGISTADWSMDFKTGGHLAFRERFGTPSNTLIILRNAYGKINDNRNDKYTCADLGVKSEKQFDEFMASPQFLNLIKEKEESKRDPFIISRCTKCHESGDYSIPQISFSNPQQFKEELNFKSRTSSRKLIDEIKYRLGDYVEEDKRMPLGPMITNKQRTDFLRYIDQLSKQTVGR